MRRARALRSLVEESGAVTIVYAGMPGYWRSLLVELASMGRSLSDVRAIVLTHAQTDHIGFAERIRTESWRPILVHELDALRAKGQVPAPNELRRDDHPSCSPPTTIRSATAMPYVTGRD